MTFCLVPNMVCFGLVHSEKKMFLPWRLSASNWLTCMFGPWQGFFSPFISYFFFLKQRCSWLHEPPRRRKTAAAVYSRLTQKLKNYLPLHSPGLDLVHRLMHSPGHRSLFFYYIPWKGKGTYKRTTFNLIKKTVYTSWWIHFISRNLFYRNRSTYNCGHTNTPIHISVSALFAGNES